MNFLETGNPAGLVRWRTDNGYH